MLRIGVLCSGGGTNLQALIDASGEGKYELGLVIASGSDAYALERAKKHGIPNLCIRKKDYIKKSSYENKLVSVLREHGIGLVVLAGFNIILGESFIQAFKGCIMNTHPSLIPSFCGQGYYGMRVHEAVLEAGVKISGATVHFATEITDGGPIILQKSAEVLEDDTPESLQRRVMELEWRILPEAVGLFAENRLIIEGKKVRVLPPPKKKTW